jgi:MFS transporter, DHA3 family, macrolide efflux protein
MLAAAIIALPALARQGTISGPFSEWLASFANGAPLAIGIDAITFFIAAITLIFLYIPSPRRSDVQVEGKPKQSLLDDIKIGALYIWRRRPLLWLLGTFTLANFVGGPLGVFQPLIVKFNLHANWQALGYQFETALALLASIGAIGGLIGGVIVSAWGGLKSRRVYGVIIPLIIEGLSLVVFGVTSLLYVAAAMTLISAAMIPFMNSHSQTIWQTQTPRELQGRVFSVRRVIAQFTWPLSTVFAGWAGGLFNPGNVIAVLGAILVVFCVLQLFNPYLLRVEDKAYLDQLAEQAASN